LRKILGSGLVRVGSEILVIVVSVVAALALDTWWGDRGDEAREGEILADLLIEFGDNREILSEDLAKNAVALGATREVVRFASEPIHPVSADSGAVLIRQALRTQIFDARNAVLGSVLAAGEFALISDPALRAALSEWQDGAAELRRKDQNSLDWINNHIVPELLMPGTDPAIQAVALTGRWEVHEDKLTYAIQHGETLLAVADTVIALIGRAH
jgi:hypothetical protein